MELDPRVTAYRLEFPIKQSNSGLKPMRTYYGRVHVEVSEPVAVSQLRLLFEGWERVDFGAKIGSTRKLLFRSAEDLLQTSSMVVDMIVRDAVFEFACTMPNVNFPAAMRSAICEVVYTISATLVGSSQHALRNSTSTACANHITTLAAASVPVQLAPKVVPSGVGWLKPMIMRDGITLTEPVRRRFRRQTVQTAMNICLQVRNHCCTLGEAIMVDVDATMLQRDRVLTFVRAAVIEQVSLKTHVEDAKALESINAFLTNNNSAQSSTVVLAERTLNRKVSEIDPSSLNNPGAKDWGTSAASQPLMGLHGVQNLRIRVPRRDVCTAEGYFLSFSHVLRLTFGLTSRPANGQFDTKYATKDVPLRLVTSKFGDVGRMSQVEINKRLSALTTESDGGAVSAAYGYLLTENSRVLRPESLVAYAGRKETPAPRLEVLVDPNSRPYTPSPQSIMTSDCMTPTSMTTAEMRTPTIHRQQIHERDSTGPAAPCPGADSLAAPSTPIPERPIKRSSAIDLLPERHGFQFGPLPPIPPAISADTYQQAEPRPTSNSNDIPSDMSEPVSPVDPDESAKDALSVSRPHSAAESILYIVSHSGEQSIDKTDALNGSNDDGDDNDNANNNNRDTLVELQPATPSFAGSIQNSSIMSHNATGSEYEYCSAKSHASALDSSSADLSAAKSDVSSTENTSTTASIDEKRVAKMSVSDKRESSQSEGETIIFSPRSDADNISSCDGDKHRRLAIDGLSTRSSTPEPKHADPPVLPALPLLPALPSIPTINSLDEIAKDLLNSSSVFADEMDFSSFWTTGANL
ncbi:hypothetical protein GGI15_000232 [Coemansia interrupta]|uniref:Uncharacterized protein n=1 Tax=Coemansia interrupta TaxID=1126814 RepID=A0A9W8LP36_9FUNG|nr:hypothetical protein GGI15_000232 [Coemansia interrupta]